MNKLILIGILLAAALSRLIPHPPNFTPIVAMGLLGGAFLNDKKLAVLVPIMAMLLADLLLGFHNTMIWVYGSLLLITGIGMLLKGRVSLINTGAATLGSSLLFFVVTNFGVWLSGTFYAKTLAGLMQCYSMAIPFFANSLAGDIVYASLLFGGFALLKKSEPNLALSNTQE